MKINLKSIFLISIGFLGLLSFSQNTSDSLSGRPNILFILVDDLKPNLGVYQDEYAISPNIDNLANSGTRFDLAYANQAVCVASRYNIMLGSRSTSTGLYRFGKDFRTLYPNAITLPQFFKNSGYHVESMGKVYHIGHGNHNDPLSWSVPHHEDKVIDYILPESTGRKLTREEAYFENAFEYTDSTLNIRDLPRGAAWEAPDVLDNAYADGRTANHAINRLRDLSKHDDKPFFLAVGFARPHLPFSVPKKYWDYYDPLKVPLPDYEKPPQGAPEFAVKKRGELFNFDPIQANGDGLLNEELKRKLIHGYYASISYMDAQVGKVLKELQRLGLDKNTIIVLWGDHGWHLGDHGIWTKHTNYEQATRIPLIIKVPNAPENTAVDQPVETVDIYPTLVDLANFNMPGVPQPIDGKSLRKIIFNPTQKIKNHIYHTFIRNGYLGEAIRTKRHRMVRWTHLKNKNMKEFELYDYAKDPLEKENIANQNPELLAEMVTLLEQFPAAKEPY